MLPTIEEYYQGGESQDNATFYTSKKVQKFFSKLGCKGVVLVRNSPDLNPTENLWSIAKQRMMEHEFTTTES